MSFITADINISKINLCILVPAGAGQPIHKNRLSHGLVIQLSGVKRYVFDEGGSFSASAGDVFYLPKFSNYRVETLDEGDCIAVNFDLYDESITFKRFIFSPSHPSRYEQSFRKLLGQWNMKGDGYLNVCRMLIYGLVCDIQTEMSKNYISPKTKTLVSESVKYIYQNISDYTLTVAKISSRFEISPEYFRKIFRSVYGISPRRYIIEARMQKAVELLLSGEFTVSDISRICGYDSESYFSTEFKRFYGIPPSEYK